jgi:L1 cell adhesion molecule like protein
LDSAVDEAISWLDVSQEASIEEYSEKQMELESIANTIMQKLYFHEGPGAA